MEKDTEMSSKEKPEEESIKTRKPTKGNPKPKVTVPQPFSLATEKRTMIERRDCYGFQRNETNSFKIYLFELQVRLQQVKQVKVKSPYQRKAYCKGKLDIQGFTIAKLLSTKKPSLKSETKKVVVRHSKSLASDDQVKTLPKSDNNKIEGKAEEFQG
ncbi:hypothetical protein OSB04_009727, partial [Centaurea solstitialis]